jgi:hypothetical protein
VPVVVLTTKSCRHVAKGCLGVTHGRSELNQLPPVKEEGNRCLPGLWEGCRLLRWLRRGRRQGGRGGGCLDETRERVLAGCAPRAVDILRITILIFTPIKITPLPGRTVRAVRPARHRIPGIKGIRS